jgi:DNA-binding CsgD family transcriptional regulator
LLTEAGEQRPLEGDDLERLATAAYMLGDGAWQDAWARAYQYFREREEAPRAARCAFWLGYALINVGEMARAAGWFGRAQRVVDEAEGDLVERGYLLLPAAIEECGSNPAGSLEVFRQTAEIGRRHRDADLLALSQHGQGRALILLSEPSAGMAVLDEVLVALTTDELSPVVVGDIYCGVIEACHDTWDVRRAREWTAAFSRWCAAQPDLVPFRGECLVYRSAVMQRQGAWRDAMTEAVAACARLMDPSAHPAAGGAHYQQAELHRLRGEFVEAEACYRLADQHGRDPQPGLALLRLAQGEAATGLAGLRRALEEARDPVTRLRLLPAAVEIMLANGAVPEARKAADELCSVVENAGSACMSAVAAHAMGTVLLEEGDPANALVELRRALHAWQSLEAPYEGARARERMAAACEQLGDSDGAGLERQAARHVFDMLGAAPDSARLDAPSAAGGPQEAMTTSSLTARELDVLRLLATGRTNRAIGDELVISEKTVARHISNIFSKLGLASRAAATAYAYEHGLTDRRAT